MVARTGFSTEGLRNPVCSAGSAETQPGLDVVSQPAAAGELAVEEEVVLDARQK